jgi:hypothetical protein
MRPLSIALVSTAPTAFACEPVAAGPDGSTENAPFLREPQR